ncbi:preprotein translocase subunit SecA [Novipirellula artificiosorum]|uniref:Preprotein translocase subunit SecA n=1 Tax=Novipirellula artificiosorum TaxID=2528016 RepID=A0A5C6DIX1_9BACT|nr:preprotein translocase subunit SecA [Novipirellula artificiosorum]TWU36175.1 preprotein translocase subunit SecA [Novipirellula artificiosorum]
MSSRVFPRGERAKQARCISGRLHRPDWIPSQLQRTRQLSEALRDSSDAELAEQTDRLRRSVTATSEDELIPLAAASVVEAVRRVMNLDLFDVQLHAGLIVACDAVAEMQTGEGKTLSGIFPTYYKAIRGRGVHVVMPNEYLASRDYEYLTPVFHRLATTTGLIGDDRSRSENRQAYRADVTYGPAHTFGFDFLRDQVLADRSSRRLGDRVFEMLERPSESELPVQRGLYAAIIDEVDHVLIDDAVSPLLLSAHQGDRAVDASIHLRAIDVAKAMNPIADFYVDRTTRQVHLSDAGYHSAYRHTEMAIHPRLVRPWHEYVVLALRTAHLYHRDVEYVVHQGKVKIVDSATGRIFEDRSWSDGLHQAVEAAEGLPITPERYAVARITRQRFFREYECLAGMTGTVDGCQHEFATVYGVPVMTVPLRVSSQRQRLADAVTPTSDAKWQQIAEETERLSKAGRPVLIGTSTISESHEIAEHLSQRGLSFHLLNGVQDADEASIVALAGRSGAITVATNLAGRGTDITLDSEAEQAGGLHVIVSQRNPLSRVERQLIGRCARCGDPGSARVYLSAEDQLICDHAPWIRRAIVRATRLCRTPSPKIERYLRRIQADRQRHFENQRWKLLQSDQDRELMLRRGQAAIACDQL